MKNNIWLCLFGRQVRITDTCVVRKKFNTHSNMCKNEPQTNCHWKKKTRPYIYALEGLLGSSGATGRRSGSLGGRSWDHRVVSSDLLQRFRGVFRLLLGRSSGALCTHLGSFFASPGCSSAALLALSGRSLGALWALWVASWEPPWFSSRALRMLCWPCQGQQQASDISKYIAPDRRIS